MTLLGSLLNIQVFWLVGALTYPSTVWVPAFPKLRVSSYACSARCFQQQMEDDPPQFYADRWCSLSVSPDSVPVLSTLPTFQKLQPFRVPISISIVFLRYSYTLISFFLITLLLLRHISRVWLCATPQTAAHQAPPSLGFSRQERWSGLPFPSPMHESEKWKWSHSVVSDSSRPHGLQPTRLLCPWDFPGKSTGVGCHCLLCLITLDFRK